MSEIWVISLISLGFLSLLAAFVCDYAKQKRSWQTMAWVRDNYPALYADLPMAPLKQFRGYRSLQFIYHRHMIQDPRFFESYFDVKALNRREWFFILTALLALGMVLAGHLFFGWKY